MRRPVTGAVALALSLPAAVRAGEGPLAEKALARRVTEREFPSVFQAWNPADNLKEEPQATAARHDLIFHGAAFFGLKWNDTCRGQATGYTEASIRQGRVPRRELLGRNRNPVLLMET